MARRAHLTSLTVPGALWIVLALYLIVTIRRAGVVGRGSAAMAREGSPSEGVGRLARGLMFFRPPSLPAARVLFLPVGLDNPSSDSRAPIHTHRLLPTVPRCLAAARTRSSVGPFPQPDLFSAAPAACGDGEGESTRAREPTEGACRSSPARDRPPGTTTRACTSTRRARPSSTRRRMVPSRRSAMPTAAVPPRPR